MPRKKEKGELIIGVPDPDPGAKSSSDPADFGAVMRSADPF